MAKDFKLSEAISVKIKDGIYKICPECADHNRGEPSKFYDCKNVFINEKGESVSQCMCYSEEHGKREMM